MSFHSPWYEKVFTKFAICGRMSSGLSATIYVRKAEKVSSYLSLIFPFHVMHSMPFSRYRAKFSLRLSMISVRCRGRPKRLRSLMKAFLSWVVCYRYRRCYIRSSSGSSLSRMISA